MLQVTSLGSVVLSVAFAFGVIGRHLARGRRTREHLRWRRSRRGCEAVQLNEDGLPGPMRNNLRPNRTVCPVPSHLGQTWCAWPNTQARGLGLPLHFEHVTHGLKSSDTT